MDKIKLLTWSVFGLLFLNLSIIAFLFFNNPNRNHPEPRKIIIEKLHFDKQQQQQYEQLINWHRSQITSLENQIRETKNELYLQLIQNKVDSKTKDSLIICLSQYQIQVENIHFKHFQDIKNLCKKEQLKDFGYLTTELSRIFLPPPKPQK